MDKKNIVVWILVAAAIVIAVIFWAWPASNSELIARASYTCDGGKTIAASYYKDTQAPPPPAQGQPPTPNSSVKLALGDGRSMTLPQTISADGGRYANADESFVFWSKGYGAFIMESGTTTYANCLHDLATTSYVNAAGGYSFAVPSIWNAVANKHNAKNSLFGPDASSTSGLGGVEVFTNQRSINAFLGGVATTYTGKTPITVDGVTGVRVNYNVMAGTGVVLLKNGTIYNIYINSAQDDDIGYFGRLIASFKFAR